MENIPGGPVRGLGPRPGDRRPSPPGLSQSRADLLDRLRSQPEPTTLSALVSATGLHANTVREHLDALEERGLVQRHRSTPSGRGRPAWRYEATASGAQRGQAEYAGLAAALAGAIHRTSEHPRDDAVAAGEDWGRELAGDRPRPQPGTAAAARRQVVEMLDELGFEPRADERVAVVKLTRCPLLEAAHRHPDVVCGVHLGIVRGALEVYGGDPGRTDLVPFSEPGACRLDLMLRPGRAVS